MVPAVAEGLIIHAVSSLQVGGAERLVLDLAAVQQRQGLTPLILNFGAEEDPLCGAAQRQGTAVTSLSGLGSSYAKMKAIARTLGSGTPAALHIHSPWCLPRLALLLPFFKGNVVYTRHGAHAYDSVAWKLLHRWTHLYVDQITFVSQQAADVHVRAYGAKTIPHTVLEFGVDVPPRRNRPFAADRPVRFGCVGRLVEVKGQSILIEALARLRSTVPCELHLFGDGPDREKLEALGKQVAPGKVHFHGTVLDRGEIYRDLDLLVVASRMEGLSLAIMEAMAHEIAVLATDVGGNSRLIAEGRTGLLLPYGDASALAQALDRLLDDPALRARLAASGRALIESSFSLEKSAARLLPVYALG
jgi:glycosyltransferase involved in cell wall biosynthesis